MLKFLHNSNRNTSDLLSSPSPLLFSSPPQLPPLPPPPPPPPPQVSVSDPSVASLAPLPHPSLHLYSLTCLSAGQATLTLRCGGGRGEGGNVLRNW